MVLCWRMAWFTTIARGEPRRRRNAPVGELLPADRPKPRKGERAAMIRQLAVRFPEFSKADIARQVESHPTNVDRVLSRYLGNVHKMESLREFQSNRSDIYDAVSMRMLSSI